MSKSDARRGELDHLYKRMFLAEQSAPEYADSISREIDEWLRRTKVEVWDEGHGHGAAMPGLDSDVHNPYRQEAADDDT